MIDALKNTPFYHPLDAIRHTEEPSLFDYEGSLDVYYFSYIWKQKDKLLKEKKDRSLRTVMEDESIC